MQANEHLLYKGLVLGSEPLGSEMTDTQMPSLSF